MMTRAAAELWYSSQCAVDGTGWLRPLKDHERLVQNDKEFTLQIGAIKGFKKGDNSTGFVF